MNKQDKREYRSTLNRDKNRCIICGNNIVELHHVVYRSLGGITDRKNMVCLCKKHHMEYHNKGKEGREELLDYLRGYYGVLDIKDLKGKNKWEAYKE